MLPYRRAIARLHVVTLLLVLAAAAVRAPLRAEGTVPNAAISAVVACLVVFAIQGLLGVDAGAQADLSGPADARAERSHRLRSYRLSTAFVARSISGWTAKNEPIVIAAQAITPTWSSASRGGEPPAANWSSVAGRRYSARMTAR